MTMTSVGKILVVVIVFFSTLFLGVSTVAFTTATDWKKATGTQSTRLKDVSGKNTDLTNQLNAAQQDLAKAKAEHTTAIAAAEKRNQAIEDEIKRAGVEIGEFRTKIETAQANTRTALEEAKQRLEETTQLRAEKAEVEKQAAEFKAQQVGLLDKIRELERLNKTLEDNTKDLRDRVTR